LPVDTKAERTEREFKTLLRARQLKTVFQPIVHLGTGTTVGYEALVRGPAGSSLTSAPSLLKQAYRTGQVVEFDWAARASACRAAMAAGLATDKLLFLNIEPLALGSDCPPDLWPDTAEALRVFQIVLELTERSLDHDPRSLLEGIDRQRPTAAGLAIDDVRPKTTSSLSLLPVIAPDVIKLDLTVTQAGPSRDAAMVLDIAYEEAERRGATILAEGVETHHHADFVQSAGATLGQGMYFGEPRPLNTDGTIARDGPEFAIGSTPIPDLKTPFEALEGWSLGRGDERLLVPLTHQVVHREVPPAKPALVLVLVPDVALFTLADRHWMGRVARRGVIAGALGPGLPSRFDNGIRGAAKHDRQLEREWAVIALSPGTASAMLARALPDATDRFEFGVTHDRRRVVAAARSLLRRLGPL
jgi:EAL domain-containing protein (putative c-di-GMP-specific phosphodiesterase class I)